MLAAAGIQWGAAMSACVAARHVLVDRHLISANAAEHCPLSPFLQRPDLDRMAGRIAGQGLVTLFAGKIDTAALHLDSDNIESGSIVHAASLRIQIDSANFRARDPHRSTIGQQ